MAGTWQSNNKENKKRKQNQDAAGKRSLKSEDFNLMTSFEWEKYWRPLQRTANGKYSQHFDSQRLSGDSLSPIFGFFSFPMQSFGVEHKSIFSSAGKSSFN